MLLENIKIISVGEVQTGISNINGKPWSNRNILLGFEDETGESFINAVADTSVWQKLGLLLGQVVTLHLRFRTRKGGKAVWNDIRIIDPETLEAS